MKLITFEEKDALALLDQLKLEALHADPSMILSGGAREQMTVGDMHRTFHYVVVRWLQGQGASCVR